MARIKKKYIIIAAIVIAALVLGISFLIRPQVVDTGFVRGHGRDAGGNGICPKGDIASVSAISGKLEALHR